MVTFLLLSPSLSLSMAHSLTVIEMVMISLWRYLFLVSGEGEKHLWKHEEPSRSNASLWQPHLQKRQQSHLAHLLPRLRPHTGKYAFSNIFATPGLVIVFFFFILLFFRQTGNRERERGGVWHATKVAGRNWTCNSCYHAACAVIIQLPGRSSNH